MGSQTFHGFILNTKKGHLQVGFKKTPLAGLSAVVESSGDIRNRSTLTRMAGGAAAGSVVPFVGTGIGLITGAVVRKRQDNRKWFLTIVGPGYARTVEFESKEEAAARRFAAQVNAGAMAAAS